MNSVKRLYRDEEVHATLLMGLLMREVSATFADEDWDGLRQAHFRVLSAVPPEGTSVTDLASRLGMTKQGCGQLVTFLADAGQLRVMTDRIDRRVRLIRRTPKGGRTVARVTARMLEIEEEWAERVGERRYRTFRRVLEDLAQPRK